MKTNEVLENIKARLAYGLILVSKFQKKICRLFWKLQLMHPVECIWKHGTLLLFKM